MACERYVQIGLDEVLRHVLNNNENDLNAIYCESNYGGEVGLVKAIGLQKTFTLDQLREKKWFRREISNAETKRFETFHD